MTDEPSKKILENLKTVAENELQNDGYKNYELPTISYTIGTNVGIVVAKTDDKQIIMTIDVNTWKLLYKAIEQTLVLEEMSYSGGKAISTASLFFELDNKVYMGGNMVSSPEIELIPDSDQNYLRGFVINLPDQRDESIKIAKEKARRFVNYLCGVTRTVVDHKLPRTIKRQHGKSTNILQYSIDTILVKKQDLDLTKISPILDSSSSLNKHLSLLQEGLKSLNIKDYAGAVSKFHQVIENTNLPEKDKYFPLRHAASHERINGSDAIKELQNFGINMNVGDSLNTDDPDIQLVLEREANNLKNISWSVVENELLSTI